MKKSLRVIAFIIICCVGISSCVEDVDFTTGYNKQIVVNCILVNPARTQTLFLSYNLPIGENGAYEPVGEVEATLFENGTPLGTFERVDAYRWKIDKGVRPGRTYRIEIKNSNGDLLAKSTTTLPPDEVIREIRDSPTLPERTREFYESIDRDKYNFIQETRCGPVWIVYTSRRKLDEGKKIVFPGIWTNHPYWDDFNSVLGGASVNGESLGLLRIGSTLESNSSDYPYVFTIGDGNESLIRGNILYVSTELDQYMKEGYERALSIAYGSDSIFSMSEFRYYTNIEGGLGIFGGMLDYNLFADWF